MSEASALDVPDVASFGVDVPPRPPEPPARADARPPDLERDAGVQPPYMPALDPERVQQVTGGLISLTQGHMRQQSFVDGQEQARIERHRAQMEQAYQAEGEAKNAVPPPWNADKEREQRVRGPMEQFGSVGSVFAMMASLFTKTPMVSALNAGAAAMRSIQEHDEKGYESAYKAWKDNTQLALKRFDMERAAFDDANKLINTDMNAWKAKTFANAARFGDQKTLLMLENGMVPEILEAQSKSIEAAKKIVETKKAFEEYNRDKSLLADGIRAWREANPDATPQQDVQHRLQLLLAVKSAERGLLPQRASQNPEWQYKQRAIEQLMKPESEGGEGLPYDQAAEVANQRWKASNQAPEREGSDRDFVAKRKALLMKPAAEGGEGLGEAAAEDKAREKLAELKRSPLTTNDREDADERKKERARLIAQGVPEKEAAKQANEYVAQLKARRASPSGNRIDQMKSMVSRIDYANETIDKAEALLKKHNALTGLGGKITRPLEVVSNWFGSNETDRAEFRRYISLLQEWGTRILNESTSRPLSAEESRIAAIVPGLSPGDTTVNTARGLKELQDLHRKMKRDLEERMKVEPRGSIPAPASPAAPASPWWKGLPDKRSELPSESEAA